VVDGVRTTDRCELVEADAARRCGSDSDPDFVRRDGTNGVETVSDDRGAERVVDSWRPSAMD